MTTTLNFSSVRSLDPLADEQNLIRLSQAGNQETFARLYDAYIERIYRYVYFRVADEELAEDITSQVFLKVWEKLHTYQEGQSPFMAWLTALPIMLLLIITVPGKFPSRSRKPTR